jgi:hypothetical protein
MRGGVGGGRARTEEVDVKVVPGSSAEETGSFGCDSEVRRELEGRSARESLMGDEKQVGRRGAEVVDGMKSLALTERFLDLPSDLSVSDSDGGFVGFAGLDLANLHIVSSPQGTYAAQPLWVNIHRVSESLLLELISEALQSVISEGPSEGHPSVEPVGRCGACPDKEAAAAQPPLHVPPRPATPPPASELDTSQAARACSAPRPVAHLHSLSPSPPHTTHARGRHVETSGLGDAEFLPDAATAVLYAADLLDTVDNAQLAALEPLDVRRHFLSVEREMLRGGCGPAAPSEDSQIFHKLIFDLINHELEQACAAGVDTPWSAGGSLRVGARVPRSLVGPGVWAARGRETDGTGGGDTGEAVRRHLLARVGELASMGERRSLQVGDKQEDVLDVEAQLEAELRAMDRDWVRHEEDERGVMRDITSALLDELLVDSILVLTAP